MKRFWLVAYAVVKTSKGSGALDSVESDLDAHRVGEMQPHSRGLSWRRF